MRSVRFTTYGGLDVLEIVDVPEPHAGDGEIRIAVRASSPLARRDDDSFGPAAGAGAG